MFLFCVIAIAFFYFLADGCRFVYLRRGLMNTLGISCFYHDSSAALVSDGKILNAAQEERFSRERNTSEFPIQAINFCVQDAGITFDDIDNIAYFEKPFLKFSRVLIDHLNELLFTASLSCVRFLTGLIADFLFR